MSDLAKKAIASSFKNLLLKKPLSEIKVGDITAECGLNRQTFYYHFANIPSLIEWICVTDVDKILQDNRHYDSWEEGFLAIFMLILQDRPFVMNIYESTDPKILVRYLYRLVNPLVLGVVNEEAKDFKTVTASDKQFIADFYTDAFVGIVLSWIEKGMKEDPRRIISRLSPLVKGTFHQALSQYALEDK